MLKVATLTLLMSSSVSCAKSLQGISACDKSIKFESFITQRIQKMSGIETVQIRSPLENHYYPQMIRPKMIIVTSKKKIKEITLMSDSHKNENIKVELLKDGPSQFSLPKFKSFNGKILVHLESGERCGRDIHLEELSP